MRGDSGLPGGLLDGFSDWVKGVMMGATGLGRKVEYAAAAGGIFWASWKTPGE